jgi:hypothetical protein
MKATFEFRRLFAGGARWLALLLITAAPGARADFGIDWYTVDGGAGTSVGGVYSVSGTIGQPDAGGAMSGGDYSLTGGFWSLNTAVPPPPPLLGIQISGNMVMVYWPSPSTGFNPQVNTSLATPNWVTPAETVQDNGSIKYLLVSPPAGNRFYRLKHP